jgi:flagellar biosynthesis protein FlhA
MINKSFDKKQFKTQLLSQLTCSDTFLSLSVVGLLVLMIVPMTAGVLDFLIALSIASSLGILLMAVFNKQSSDFSIFPSLLLLVTLYRLALNVASTRLILTNGKEGVKAAGELIAAFGEVVVHGNTFVGILVFVILNVINFIVITKGAGRISEVAARFMLDSLPGRQMSVDSDLKSGAISPEAAQARRAEIDQQADFYGAMDGASKFVKGDAIACLVIVAINILGGLFVGIAQEGMSFAQAIKTYTLLTVGEGLVAQFPALIISTAAGIVITKAGSSKKALGQDFADQITANPKVFWILSGILFCLGLFVKSAMFAFSTLSFICFALAFYVSKKIKNQKIINEENLKAIEEFSFSKDQRYFEVRVGLALANQLTRDSHLHEDLDRFVNDLSRKNGQELPFIKLEDSSEAGLFDYVFCSPEGEVIYEGRLQDKDYYIVGSAELKEFDQRFVHDPLLSRPCAWISSKERDDLIQRGMVVVNAGELFRWHLFLAYRKNLNRELNKNKEKGVELNNGIQNI